MRQPRITLVALLVLSSSASADRIYDNGDPDGSNGLSNIFDGGVRYDRQVADDFVLTGGPGWIVNNVEMNYVWDTIGSGGASNFRVTFYADDAGGGPGTIISDQVSKEFTETPTGNVFFSRPEQLFSINISAVALAADTTYWVAIQPNGVESGFQLTSASGVHDLNGDEAWIRYPDLGVPEYAPASTIFAVFYDVSFRLRQTYPEPCRADLDGNGNVGLTDLLLLLEFWGDPYGLADLLDLLAAWGPCP